MNLYLVEGVEKVVEATDERELLVLKRTLSGLKSNLDEKRENIFTQRARLRKMCA